MAHTSRGGHENEVWDLAEAEMAIAFVREQLNHALAYRVKYNADKHNVALAFIRYQGGASAVLAAYSNDSAIAESDRLNLGLVPDLSSYLPQSNRFGCGGMAQFHTEPKLLNYLCADSTIRKLAIHQHEPQDLTYRSIIKHQRECAAQQADFLRRPLEEIAAVTLVTEINCCKTCTSYSISRFRARYPNTPIHLIELGKHPGKGLNPKFTRVTIERIKRT